VSPDPSGWSRTWKDQKNNITNSQYFIFQAWPQERVEDKRMQFFMFNPPATNKNPLLKFPYPIFPIKAMFVSWNSFFGKLLSKLSCVCLLLEKLVNEKHFPVNGKHFPVNEKHFPVNGKHFPVNENTFRSTENTF